MVITPGQTYTSNDGGPTIVVLYVAPGHSGPCVYVKDASEDRPRWMPAKRLLADYVPTR